MGDLLKTTFGGLGQLFDGPHATPTRRSDGPYFLNIASLKSGRLDLTESDHVSNEDFKKWTRRVTPQPGDLLFSYETRLGEAALMPEGIQACLGRRMALLRPDRSVVLPKFLIYFYLSPQFQQIISMNTIHGATVPRIGLATMPKWQVSLPPLPKQQALAEVLGALDDKIVANDRILSKVKDLLIARFADLQVDVDADEPVATELSKLVTLNPRLKAPSGDEPAYLDMRNLPNQAITIESWSHRTPRGGARFQNGDTLLARITPCLENGKTGFVDFLEPDEVGIGSTEFIVMRAQENVPAAFVYFLAISPRFREFAIRHMVGTSGRQRLSAGDLAGFRLRRPDDNLLNEFGRMSESLMLRVKATVNESRALREMRDELLPLLMSGKIRVKDAERAVEEVV